VISDMLEGENTKTHHHISKYERGKSVPPIEVVLAYSRVANVLIEQIVDDEVDLPLKYSARNVQQRD
jgi:transcriptional regulator with XRE-family HTH domain